MRNPIDLVPFPLSEETSCLRSCSTQNCGNGGRQPLQIKRPGDRQAMGRESIYEVELRQGGARREITLRAIH
jgi:hypothetical protein